MTRVKLGQVAREYKGKVSNEMAGSLPIVGLEHLSSGDIDLLGCDAPGETTFTKTFKEGHVLFGRRRAYLRKASIATFEGVCSGDIIVIEADETRLSSRLLPFIIQSNSLFDFAVENSAGSLSPRVKWQRLAEYEFDLPSLDEQEKLAEVLWAAQETKRKYRQLLEASDDIIKARFVEMFGDIFDNPHGWLTRTMGEIAPHDPDKVVAREGTWLLNLDAIEPHTGAVLFKNIVGADEVNGSICAFSSEHVLYSKLRPYLNKVVVPGESGVCTTELLALRPEPCLNREYLAWWLRSDMFVSFINAKTAGAKMPRVDLKCFRMLDVAIPPIEFQEEFAAFVHQVDKSKVELQRSLDDLNAMMAAILNEELGLQNV